MFSKAIAKAFLALNVISFLAVTTVLIAFLFVIPQLPPPSPSIGGPAAVYAAVALLIRRGRQAEGPG